MNHFLFVLTILLSIPGNSFAQTGSTPNFLEVYPVRVNHKWGYVKFYGNFVDTLIAPRYEYIGDINLPWYTKSVHKGTSPYRVFEIDNKVGILDLYLNECLPNAFKRIRPLSEKYFAIEKDSLFTLIDHNQKELLNSERFDDISADRFDDELRYFFLKKDKLWAISDLNGKLLTDYIFADIQASGVSGFFNIKKQNSDYNWTLVDDTGQPVLKESYVEINVLHKNIITVRRDGEAFLKYYFNQGAMTGSENRFVLQAGNFEKINVLNDKLIAFVDYDALVPTKAALWNLESHRPIKSFDLKTVGGKNKQLVPYFHPMNEKYALISDLNAEENNVAYALLNQQGQTVSLPFDTIVPTNKKDIYAIRNRNTTGGSPGLKWGLLLAGTTPPGQINCAYDEIYNFEDDIAITRNGKSYGAIAVKDGKSATIPCLFDNIYKTSATTVQVQGVDNLTVIYKLTDEFTFVEESLHAGTLVVSKTVAKQLKEAAHSRIPGLRPNHDDFTKPIWKDLSFKQDKGVLTIKNGKKIVGSKQEKKKVKSVVEVAPDIVAIYYLTQPYNTSFTKTFTLKPVAAVELYNCKLDKVISNFPMIGLRAFQEGRRYTAFVDPSGKMGLVDKEGQQVIRNSKPLRYAYIGPFYQDRARVCIGEKLVMDKHYRLPQPSGFVVSKRHDFLTEFQIKPFAKPKPEQEINYEMYAVATKGNCLWGFIDPDANMVIEPEDRFVQDFNSWDNTTVALKSVERKNMPKPGARYGVIDNNGNELLELKYRSITSRKNHFNILVGNTPTFYFTKTGHQLFVNPTRMRPFYEDYALFRSADDKWGYVDTLGNIAIPPKYKIARPFSDGLALVVDSTGYCSFIDKKGHTVFATPFPGKQWPAIGDFHDGRCWFKGASSWFWGCYNKTGEAIIPSKYYYKIKSSAEAELAAPYPLPMDFSKSVAAVQVIDAKGKDVYTVIDTVGKRIVTPGEYGSIERFDQSGISIYSNKEKNAKGLLNYEGKTLTKPLYKRIDKFESGVAKVQGANGKWGLLSVSGKLLLPTKFKAVGKPSEGLVAVQTNDSEGWYFADLSGRKIIEGPFQEVSPFQNGISMVTYKEQDFLIDKKGVQVQLQTGRPVFFSDGIIGMLKNPNAPKKFQVYFYADESGNNIFGRNFDEISPFQLGTAKVRRLQENQSGNTKKKELLGAINKRGVMIVPPKFRNLHLQSDGNIVINPQRFHGLTSKTGQVIFEPIYDRILYYAKDKIFRLEQGEKIGYAMLKNGEAEWIWGMTN